MEDYSYISSSKNNFGITVLRSGTPNRAFCVSPPRSWFELDGNSISNSGMNIGDDSHEKELWVCRVSLWAFTCKYTYSLACEREDSGGQYLSITLYAILGEARHFLAGNVGHKFHHDFTPKCIHRSLPLSQQRSLVRFERVYRGLPFTAKRQNQFQSITNIA